MNQLDNYLIRSLVNDAIENGYHVDFSNIKHVVRIYYHRGYVALLENCRGETLIIDVDFSKYRNCEFGTEIDIVEFNRIFSKCIKGRG